MRPSPSPEAFTFLFAAALLAFYFVYLQLRRLRYQKIAAELQAAYESQGVFKTGEIAGLSHGRRYRMTTKVVGRDSATYTILSMDCRNRGIPLSIHGGFFEHFPDWKFAFTRDDIEQSAFVAKLALQSALVPLDSKYHSRVQGLFHDIALIFPELLKKRSTRIDLNQDALSYRMRGVLKNAGTVRQILLLLTKIVDRIESDPVNA